MARVRRTKYAFLRVQDGKFLDIQRLLRGTAKLERITQTYAISLLTRREYPVTTEELEVLVRTPSEKWTSMSRLAKKPSVDLNVVDSLLNKGLLLSDRPDNPTFVELRRRDEKLSSIQWNIYAALYHFMTRWQDVQVKLEKGDRRQSFRNLDILSQKELEKTIAEHGLPPNHFHHRSHVEEVYELPLVEKETPLYKLLRERKTTRELEAKHTMQVSELSQILYYVYGCHGYAPMFQKDGKTIVGLKKTSPSGGALHPIEVYPLLINVNGLASGLYHYDVEDHSLELIENISRKEARELANQFTVGQAFPRSAQALFIMSARFYRNFWKYRNHQKAYAVVLMDTAHLSQTFYLVCAELGLGAFFTAAVNDINIEERLGIDGFEEGVLGICGCGKISKRRNGLDPEFYPYTPRKTRPEKGMR